MKLVFEKAHQPFINMSKKEDKYDFFLFFLPVRPPVSSERILFIPVLKVHIPLCHSFLTFIYFVTHVNLFWLLEEIMWSVVAPSGIYRCTASTGHSYSLTNGGSIFRFEVANQLWSEVLIYVSLLYFFLLYIISFFYPFHLTLTSINYYYYRLNSQPQSPL